MSKSRQKTKSRDAPVQQRGSVAVCSPDMWKLFCCDGYKPLSSCPEVQMCVNVYADLIANMTIQLMKNTDGGDVRIKNGLSRRLDIEPHSHMTHQAWMSNLVRVLMLEGNQITIPHYDGDMLGDLEPVPPSRVSLVEESGSGGIGYRVMVGGVPFKPEEVLHFLIAPDPEAPYKGMGFVATLKDVVGSLRQTNATKKALMKSPMPSLVIKVDGYTDDLKTVEGRKALVDQYMDQSETGRPWMVPADLFEVTQVKPMTINDLAIETSLELDKKAVAAMFGVPPFLVGIGAFDAKEFDWFVATKVMSVARIIEQELTRKLLYSPDMYFHFNNRALLNYDIASIIQAGSAMVDRAALRRNEWRDWLNLPQDPDMDDMLILENYIRKSKLEAVTVEGGGEGESSKDDAQQTDGVQGAGG